MRLSWAELVSAPRPYLDGTQETRNHAGSKRAALWRQNENFLRHRILAKINYAYKAFPFPVAQLKNKAINNARSASQAVATCSSVRKSWSHSVPDTHCEKFTACNWIKAKWFSPPLVPPPMGALRLRGGLGGSHETRYSLLNCFLMNYWMLVCSLLFFSCGRGSRLQC